MVSLREPVRIQTLGSSRELTDIIVGLRTSKVRITHSKHDSNIWGGFSQMMSYLYEKDAMSDISS